jgi:hypothetical protein
MYQLTVQSLLGGHLEVGVECTKTVPRDEAYWEKGLFAIQHTACRLRN